MHTHRLLSVPLAALVVAGFACPDYDHDGYSDARTSSRTPPDSAARVPGSIIVLDYSGRGVAIAGNGAIDDHGGPGGRA